MAPSDLKLTYFGIKGRAELSRLIFNYGGISFTDDRITKPEFAVLKPTLPFGQVPILELDGTVYAQSMAITRYAAKLAGLYPSDALEALKADVFSCSLNDVEEPFVDFMFKTQDEAEKAQKKKVFIEETVPKFFTTLEKTVAGKFILGEQLSYADVHLLDVVENKVKWVFPDFSMDVFPKLAAVVNNVKAEPKIAAYLSKQYTFSSPSSQRTKPNSSRTNQMHPIPIQMHKVQTQMHKPKKHDDHIIFIKVGCKACKDSRHRAPN